MHSKDTVLWKFNTFLLLDQERNMMYEQLSYYNPEITYFYVFTRKFLTH